MTLIIIIVIGIIIYSAITPNNKTQGEINQAKHQLPNIYLQARNMGGLLKTLNLAFDDSIILQFFSYENGVVTLTMKNGAILKASLADMEVSFEVLVNSIQTTIVAHGRKQKVITYDNFNKNEWEVILRVLALAGRTYGTSFLTGDVSDTQKNIQQILEELRYIS